MKNKKALVLIGLGLFLVVVSVVVLLTQQSSTYKLPDKDSYTFDEITAYQMKNVKYITSSVSDEIDIPYLLNTWAEKRTYVPVENPSIQTEVVIFYFHRGNKDVLFAIKDLNKSGCIQVLMNDEIRTYKVVETDAKEIAP